MSIVDINRPTPADVAAVIRRLCAAFKRPYKADMDAMVGEWHRSLAGRFGRDLLDAAVNQCVDNDPDFPSLAKFRSHCFAIEQQRQPERTASLRDQYLAWFGDLAGVAGDAIPCPVCGTCVEVTQRGYVAVHDDDQHSRARISYTNLGNPEWRHLGPWPEWHPPQKANRRHPSNPAARPLATIGDVAKTVTAKLENRRPQIPDGVRQAATKHPEHMLWGDIPEPEPPPDALLATQ